MTGLEKIIGEIESEAASGAAEIIAEAEKQAADILSEAKKSAENAAARVSEKADADAALVLSRAKAACSLEAGRRILLRKQELIADCIESARKSLASLPDEKYSALLIDMINRFALRQAGEIAFCACDAGRIGADVKSAAEAAGLTVSDTNEKSDGGFVLIYGGIEVNCTFSALFAENREKLQDKAHELLF